MDKYYKHGLIIGKFLPFHKGHHAMIDYASRRCNKLTVIVLGHVGEVFSLEQRERWLKNTYSTPKAFKNRWIEQLKGNRSNDCRIIVKSYMYDENVLDSSSESNINSSKQWCDALSDFIKDIDVIIGSEDYVRYMSEYSHKDYLIYNKERDIVSISATEIRKDPIKYWDYLMPSVKTEIARHICICGTESSGKTTLATKLEKDFEYVTMIPEIGRCLVGNANTCDVDKLLQVLDIHKQLLKDVINDPPTPIVVWDTDNYTTISYLKHFFNYDYYKSCPTANIYWFLENDIKYEKDITRINEEEAKALKESHIQILKSYNIDFDILKHSRLNEFAKEQCIQCINNIKKVFGVLKT